MVVAFPEEFVLATKDPQPPDRATKDFVAWVDELNVDQLVAVGAPACHDFAFVNYYCHRFVGRNPLRYACLDLLSLAMGRLSAKGYMDLEYPIDDVRGVRPDPHGRRHIALEDAIGQECRIIFGSEYDWLSLL